MNKLKNNNKIFFDTIKMLRFGQANVAKKKKCFWCKKNNKYLLLLTIQSSLNQLNNNSKYLTGYDIQIKL